MYCIIFTKPATHYNCVVFREYTVYLVCTAINDHWLVRAIKSFQKKNSKNERGGGVQENQYETPSSNTVELEESTCITNLLLK